CPQLFLLIEINLKNPKKAEFFFLSLDFFIMGTWTAIIHFQPWFGVPVLINMITCCIGLRGFLYAIQGILTFTFAAVIIGYFTGYQVQLQSNVVTVIVSMISIFMFVTSMSYIVYIRSKKLRVAKYKLNETTDDLKKLNEVIQQTLSSLNIDEAIKKLNPIMKEIFSYDIIFLQLVDPETKTLNVYGVYGDNIEEESIERIKKLKILIDKDISITVKILSSHEFIYYEKVVPEMLN
ncbi:MAG: hypothetical protein ACK4PR_09455, partial [Gammaproteobacteria bacterium]